MSDDSQWVNSDRIIQAMASETMPTKPRSLKMLSQSISILFPNYAG